MQKNLTMLVGCLTLLGPAAMAQSTFDYFITAFGPSNSRVTWNVTGSLATAPGAAWEGTGQFGGVPIETSGLFAAGYTGTQFPQSISAPDGSYFHNTELAQNFAINSYFAGVLGSTNIFGLVTGPGTTALGQHLTYNAGSQSVIIPIPFSDFNVG
ncbi:MAG TPA: hypothetical protein VH251_04360, partial [Verrucomicrobiae bacterium]|nr:hypothetical protein [Verrucomicrobiae bacterium]